MKDDALHESLSALVDGELTRAQAEQVMDAVLRDPALREQWRRHHLISAVLSGHSGPSPGADELAVRVAAGLAAEPASLATHRAPRRRRAWVPLALAASLTAVAVAAGLMLIDVRDAGVAPRPVRATIAGDAASPAPARVAAVTAPAGAERTRMTWNDARPAVEARLNGYLLDHNEYLAGGVRGMLPYARVVGYDARD
jgi:sigma-E factor negative regulatory protein RseA